MSLKKTAKREAFIFLGFLFLAGICFIALINFSAFGKAGEALAPVFVSVGLYSYPVFLLVRFLIWLSKSRKHAKK